VKILRTLFLFFTLAFSALLVSQPLTHRSDWYFGRKASVHFDAQNQVSFDDKYPNTSYKRTANGYTKKGDLAFFTDGENIFDRNMAIMGSTGFVAQQIQVTNHYSNDSLYHIVLQSGSKIYHGIFNPILKQWDQQPKEFVYGVGRSFVMIKHCFASGFWIVCPMNTKKWTSYYLQGRSIQKGPDSDMPQDNPINLIDITSNHKGDKIAASNYAADGFVSMYDFDPKCGVLSNALKLPQSTTQIGWDYPLGIDFSPADNFLYVCYSNGLSQLVQYKVSDVTQNQIIHSTQTDAVQFDDIMMAPDGKAYLNRHNDGNPSKQIDVIEFPNTGGLGCTYKQNVFQLKGFSTGGFQFPSFLNATVSNYCGRSVREFADDFLGEPCVDNSIEFFTRYTSNTFTDIQWVIDYNGKVSTKSGDGITVNLTETGLLKVTKIKYFCNLSDTLRYEFNINTKPNYTLTADTTVCHGDQLELMVETTAQRIVWGTGDTTSSIKVDPGIYSLFLSNSTCSVKDTVEVGAYPPLSILLGDQFYICERENELVKLDAGKGFANYLWTPTQDTSQWIIVNKTGDYFVVVDDFRGCSGDKGTRVNTRCDLVYFVPSAISPNGDGLNDRFQVIGDGIEKVDMQIYNRWGELIFKGDGVEGWSPVNTQQGVYS